MAFFEFAGGLITRVTGLLARALRTASGREHLVERW